MIVVDLLLDIHLSISKAPERLTHLKFPKRIDIGSLLVQLGFTSLQSLVFICRSILSFLDFLLDHPQITLASLKIRTDDAKLFFHLFELLRIAVDRLCKLFDIVFGFCLTDFSFGNGIIGEVEESFGGRELRLNSSKFNTSNF